MPLALGGSGRRYRLCLPAGAVKPPFISGYAGAKTKTPSGPCSAREGVRIFGAPSIVPCGGAGDMFTLLNNLLLPRGISCSPNRWFTHATTRRVGGAPLYPAVRLTVN
jgi:hypothetical protein